MNVAFFGSSLVSSYWNGAATYYRGIVRALHERGHRVTFFEPDAYERQAHRDIDDPPWAEVVVYEPDRWEEALERLRAAGIRYAGWLPNYEAPRVFARHRVTVHVPRRPYVQALPGIPTIRVFEALACGIPLVSAPWRDAEGLFSPGRDFLVADDGRAMRRHLADVLHDDALAESLAREGRATILARHTCAHRVDELLAIHAEIAPAPEALRSTA